LHAACTGDTYRLTLTTCTLSTLLQASRIAAIPFSVDLASIVLPHSVCIPATHTPRQLSVYSSTQSVPIHSGFIFLEPLLRFSGYVLHVRRRISQPFAPHLKARCKCTATRDIACLLETLSSIRRPCRAHHCGTSFAKGLTNHSTEQAFCLDRKPPTSPNRNTQHQGVIEALNCSCSNFRIRTLAKGCTRMGRQLFPGTRRCRPRPYPTRRLVSQ
jgi:hypothetical protein